MTERAIFNEALAIAAGAVRRDYLETACAGDQALRRRVEILLHAHEAALLFLEEPIRPAAAGAVTRAEVFGDHAPDATGREDDDDEAEPLDFLQPSTRPGSLGRLSHYEVLEVLGRGGFGTVLKAFDDKLHRMVAIKVMARGLASTSPARKRFLREARAAAAIRHENVVNIHAVDEEPIPYLVMEYIDGQTLQEKLDQSGPIETPEVLRIGRQIADGLAAAHRQKLIHRDIKPGNILLEAADERVKITDFGLARAVDDASLTRSGTIAGTPLYMAPEQALGEAIDQRADLFSLGSVLYVMCTGRPPFRAQSTLAVLRRVAEDQPRPIHEVIPEVPAELCALIDRLHAKDPADRFESARAVADLLRDLQTPNLARIRIDRSNRAVADLLRDLQTHPTAAVAPRSPVRHPSARIDPEFTRPARRRSPGKPSAGGWWPRLGPGRPVVLALAVFAAVWVALELIKNYRAVIFQRDQPARMTAPLAEPLGILQVNFADPTMDATIVGEGVTIQSAGGQATRGFRLKPGRYQIISLRGDLVLAHQEVIVTADKIKLAWVDPPENETRVAQTLVPTPTGSDLGLWGRFIDPLGGSQARRDGDRLTIAIPGDSHRHLNPMAWFNTDAPRAFQPVEGNFIVEVTQLIPPRPGPADADKSRNDDGYQWGGLVIWADDKNFVRFGVGAHPEFDSGRPFLDLKHHQDVKMADEVVRYTASVATHLRAERSGSTLTLQTSTDGKTWSTFKICQIFGFPPKLSVGVAAINSGTRTFASQFENWSLQLFGDSDPEVTGGMTSSATDRDLGPWGRLVDPLGKSKAALDGDRLTIGLPDDALLDLNPGANNNMDAPRVLQAVTGDFVVQVKALPLPQPSGNASATGDGKTFHWSGLVLWANERDFLRFGNSRHSVIQDGNPYTCSEFFRHQETLPGNVYTAHNEPMYFRAERRGDTLFLKNSGDGRFWYNYQTVDLTGFPAKIHVGVGAVNTGTKGFPARFEGWSLRPLAPSVP